MIDTKTTGTVETEEVEDDFHGIIDIETIDIETIDLEMIDIEKIDTETIDIEMIITGNIGIEMIVIGMIRIMMIDTDIGRDLGVTVGGTGVGGSPAPGRLSWSVIPVIWALTEDTVLTMFGGRERTTPTIPRINIEMCWTTWDPEVGETGLVSSSPRLNQKTRESTGVT